MSYARGRWTASSTCLSRACVQLRVRKAYMEGRESWEESTRSGGLSAGRRVDIKNSLGFTVESSNQSYYLFMDEKTEAQALGTFTTVLKGVSDRQINELQSCLHGHSERVLPETNGMGCISKERCSKAGDRPRGSGKAILAGGKSLSQI